MSVVTPSYALSKRRREKREAERKKHVASENFKREMLAVNNPEDAEYAIKDAAIAEMIGHEFVRHYPGRGWQVISDIRNGIVTIYNAHVTAKYGWIWKMSDIHESTFTRDVRNIGGELLERAGLTRGEFDADEVRELQKIVSVLDKVDMT